MKTDNHPDRSPYYHWTCWLIGLGSLAWLLLRSGTNPRRLAYPCQRAALGSSTVFLSYLAGVLGIAHLYHRLKRRVTLLDAGLFALLTAILAGSNAPTLSAYAGTAALPGWTSPTAISSVFVVEQVPAPECSLDGGALPSTPPCSDAGYALRDDGVEALVDEMERRGDYFYQTAAHPTGIVGANDVVVIKVNNQWGGKAGEPNGRLATNNDVLKGLLWRIVRHPDGFSGEIVVAENTQGTNNNWDNQPANAQDQQQSYLDVVNAFHGLGYPVSLFSWDDLNSSTISGGDVDGSGYPAGEYANGNTQDAYILLEDSEGSGTDELSYPKFQTTTGISISMRYGVWDGSSYDSERLTFINLPVLKGHGMAGVTGAWKNLVGFVTIAGSESRYGSWNLMHDFFWGYTGEANKDYGLLGREMARVRTPDLNIVDAIWIAYVNWYGSVVRQDMLLASTDPFAVDWYASEHILRPALGKPSAARAGVFRNATRTNQNAAQAEWPGGSGSYPYIDLLDDYDGDSPSDDEKKQMNVYVVPSVTVTHSSWTENVWYRLADARIRFSDLGSVNAVTVTLVYSYPTADRNSLPRHYHIAAGGDGFTAALALGYRDADVTSAGLNEEDLLLYRYEGNGFWRPYSSTVDVDNNLVMATQAVTAFSTWAIGSGIDRPTLVALRGASAPGEAGRRIGLMATVALVATLAGMGWIRWRKRKGTPDSKVSDLE
ncbi:MAG: DUF362 domain-containing protein [Thermoflexales bacterium]|nr:DUF362 domain-containing protein [Thermoflexales bacterium]